MPAINRLDTAFSEVSQPTEPKIILSVVIPFFNEQEVLPEFHRRLSLVLDRIPEPCEIIYVDDGSTDSSREIVQNFVPSVHKIRCLALSRNFGKEAAMSAGLEHYEGEAVVVIDADLQDPPEAIPQMVEKWQEGYDVVNMKRSERRGEKWFKKFSAACFYKTLNLMTKLDIPENVGDFRLLSSNVVECINGLPERNRYMKGIFSWPGFKQTTVLFQRDERFCGNSKWNYFKLVGFAMDGITSFSIQPLRLATLIGGLIALSAFVYGAFIVMKTMMFGETVSGYPSMMIVQLALGGIQLLSIGLLGEYIGRIFIEAKRRPLYYIASVYEQPAKRVSFAQYNFKQHKRYHHDYK